MNITHIGLLAGALTSTAAIPQLIKSYRRRHMEDISAWQLVLVYAGLILWLVYGVILHDRPLVIANSFTLLCYTLLIVMKIAYGRGDTRVGGDYRAINTGVKEES
ncbi:MAG TPA: SemiSWEET transporter [Geobacteraceae bacterium]|nr:SemiSWEET transporter [Geobacteraceae bacterium]